MCAPPPILNACFRMGEQMLREEEGGEGREEGDLEEVAASKRS